MPHLWIEYSANLAAELDIDEFVRVAHEAAMATGVFTPGALRTRATAQRHYRIADAHPDNAFIYLHLRVGHGRDAETLKRAGEAVFAAARGHVQALFETRALGLSLEVSEIDPALSFKRNNTHEHVKARAAAGASDG